MTLSRKTKADKPGKGAHVVAIIPARGGSRRVPSKNLFPLSGIPLVAHSILHARESQLVDEIIVSTDDAEIAAVSERYGATVVRRPPDISGDDASSESALLHALDSRGKPDPDLVVFLQATSPLRRSNDIDTAIQTLLDQKADSLFSAAEDYGLLWSQDDKGALKSVNYSFGNRKREQEMRRQFRENGSMYVFRPKILREENNRLGGRIAVYEMDLLSSFQLDAPQHYEILQILATRPQFAHETLWPKQLDLVVFDFDGVMTDNTVSVNTDGVEAVICHRGDGFGITRLREAGIPAFILSTETNAVVTARGKKLNLECHHGIGDKSTFLREYLGSHGIAVANVIYLGNDVNDLGCFELVGFSVAVADAHSSVKQVVDYVLNSNGGRGAVRELCDLILERYSGDKKQNELDA